MSSVPAVAITDFDSYLNHVTKRWFKVVTLLGGALVGLFYFLDLLIVPAEQYGTFLRLRLISLVVTILQYVVLISTRPSSWDKLHGYALSINVGGMIVTMIMHLGGFSSSYYAGLFLVIIGCNLFLPWGALHTALNGSMVLVMYVVGAGVLGENPDWNAALHNLAFLGATVILCTVINFIKHGHVHAEFDARHDLLEAYTQVERTRDKLWREMETARAIQTALLPRMEQVNGFRIAALMTPADEVGGDYYDLIHGADGCLWIAIGDVSGHGMDSGLISMMTQTSVITTIRHSASLLPTDVLNSVNHVLRENISRLGANRYVTMTAFRLTHDQVSYAGLHQDIMVYRAATRRVHRVPTSGTWLGIVDDTSGFLENENIDLFAGDLLLLFTDGVTEAANPAGELFGEERLAAALEKSGEMPLDRLIIRIQTDVNEFRVTPEIHDDISLVAVKRVD